VRVPRKLGEESEAHPHGDVAKGLRIGVLPADTRGLVAEDLEMAVAADFELTLSLNGLRVRPHGESIALAGKLGFVD